MPSGAQRFTGAFKLTNADPQPVWSVVVANGVINDHGTLRFGDDNGVIHQDVFVLSQGTIVLTEPANPTTDVFHSDPVSCIGSDIATGTYQMTGTGDYAGVTGQGTYRHHAIIIAPPQVRMQPSRSPNSRVRDIPGVGPRQHRRIGLASRSLSPPATVRPGYEPERRQQDPADRAIGRIVRTTAKTPGFRTRPRPPERYSSCHLRTVDNTTCAANEDGRCEHD